MQSCDLDGELEISKREMGLAVQDAAELLRKKVTEQNQIINQSCGWRRPKSLNRAKIGSALSSEEAIRGPKPN